MKKISPLFIGIVSILFFACQSESVNKNTTTKNSSSKEITFDKEKLDLLSSKLDGYWLSDPFLLNIEKTKSIYDSREYSTTLFGFILKKDELIQNKGFLQGFSAHEGGVETSLKYNSDKNIFESDRKATAFEKPFTLRLVDDTIVELSFDNKEERYRKVFDEATELRKILLEGEYTDLLSNKEITFARDGYVTGISENNFYELYYDFGEGLWMDVVFFLNTDEEKEREAYHYKIKGDTLRLYPVTGEIPEYSVGELKYELLRKK
jgi:hypothetical protein